MLAVEFVLVLKAAHDVDNRVHLADVAQKLVAQPFAVARALHQTGNVHKLDGRGRNLLRVIHFAQHIQAVVRHHDNSRLKRVVYGARDPKAGCCGSLTDLFALPFNHHPVMEQGLLEEEAQALLQEFFAGLRAKRLKLKAEKRAQQAAQLQNEENPHE